ncbi:ABC transporter substrate-binding protein [Streptomyces sp. NPDC046900]|uniref:ABC transporter substrate-binding protein n=1 Tax=Streptomyces sp. NPDC046900 TaxID=3155473 RepID=UPI0033F65752
MKLKPGAAGAAGVTLAMVLAMSLTSCGNADSNANTSSGGVITVSYSEVVADELPLWIASEAGYFKEQGLNVKLVSLSSDQGYPALISGQTQIASIGGSQIVSGAAAGGDVKVLATMTPVFAYQLYANVDSAAKLKGKKIGYTSKSGSQYTATLAALKKAGLSPEDVNLVPLGSVTNVNNALLSKTIDAAATHPPASLQFEDAGLHMVLDLAKEKIPNDTVGISTKSSYIKDHPEVLDKFMAALKKGFDRERSDQKYATQVLGAHLGLKDQRALDETWKYYSTEVIPDIPETTEAQLASAQTSLAGSVAGVDKLDLSKLIDSSFVDKAFKGK